MKKAVKWIIDNIDNINQVEKGSVRHRPGRKEQDGRRRPAGKVQSG